MTFPHRFMVLAAGLCALSGSAISQTLPPLTPPALGHADALVGQTLAPRFHQKIRVTSSSFQNNGIMPFEYTQYRGNRFPGLNWSRGPAGTRSWLVIIQGAPERTGVKTSIHLTLYNIAPDARSLPVGMTMPPEGAVYGPNVHGPAAAYAGPHTHTLKPQAYHFQVFALDIRLPNVPGRDFDAILAAARGHVLASGELIGFAGMDPQSPEAAILRDARK